MDAISYEIELLRILRMHSDQALKQLAAMDEAMPEKALGINIGIHPSQDPDGMFGIMIHLDGPDLYSLNKAINGHRSLFAVRFVDGNLVPKVPMFNSLDLEFEVNDVNR